MIETNPKPSREPDFEDHGDGRAPDGIRIRANEAYYAELSSDAMGDPIHAPRGWWHVKLWKGP